MIEKNTNSQPARRIGQSTHSTPGRSFRVGNSKTRPQVSSNNSHSNTRHHGPSGNTERKKNSANPGGRKVMRRPRTNNGGKKMKESSLPIPPIGNNVRIIPLGGVEEVGKNMTVIEVGNDIIIIDAGFQFKDDSTPGIDYILPNTKYLEDKKDRIRGLFITHGHLDHIGGIPYIIDKLGNPPIYSREFGAIMIKKRHEEFPHLPKLDIKILDGDETISFGDNLKIETFAISHTIPDSMGLIIKTHLGDIVFIEDVRVDNINGIPTEEEVNQYKRFKDRNILLLTMDSTSIEKPGWSLSENVVVENIEKIVKNVSGRLIIGTFASQVERILAIIGMADKYGKKVVMEGRSMKSNFEIIRLLKLVKKPETVVSMAELASLPPDKVILLVTGAQGEEFAALNRMANKSHKNIQLKEEDTILLSSSIIPTNHSSVVRLKDRLYRSKAKIITYLDSDVHASGHGNREELSWIHNQIDYKYFVPLHGNHYMVRQHSDLAVALGCPPKNTVIPDDGSIIEISEGGNKMEILPMRVPHEVVTVDGFSVSDIQEVVLRDRQLLSESGIFVIVASINTRTGKLKKSPDIISRGFVYLRESQDLLHEARDLIRKSIERQVKGQSQVDFEKVKKNVANEMNKFLFQRTAKEPLVIPVILGV